MLRLIERPGTHTLVHVPPSPSAVVSWNTGAPEGEIAVIAHRADGSVSPPLPYARWSLDARRSLGGLAAESAIDVDVVHDDRALIGIGIVSSAPLDAVAVTVPSPDAEHAEPLACAAELDVPCVAQYVAESPEARGWCSAASMTMLLRYHGVHATLAGTVAGTYDDAYGGTGNWAFNAAYAGAHGLRAAVAYLDGIDGVAAFVDAGLPVAISIGWHGGELPGAPLEHSDGHLIVVRGVGEHEIAVNDPAQPAVAARYPRAALDRVFREHGAVAYLVAPRERTDELVRLANAG